MNDAEMVEWVNKFDLLLPHGQNQKEKRNKRETDLHSSPKEGAIELSLLDSSQY